MFLSSSGGWRNEGVRRVTVFPPNWPFRIELRFIPSSLIKEIGGEILRQGSRRNKIDFYYKWREICQNIREMLKGQKTDQEEESVVCLVDKKSRCWTIGKETFSFVKDFWCRKEGDEPNEEPFLFLRWTEFENEEFFRGGRFSVTLRGEKNDLKSFGSFSVLFGSSQLDPFGFRFFRCRWLRQQLFLSSCWWPEKFLFSPSISVCWIGQFSSSVATESFPEGLIDSCDDVSLGSMKRSILE